MLNKMNVPYNTTSAAGSQISTGLQNTSGQQIMTGPQFNTATNTPLPSPPGSELPFQSSTLQQGQGHSLQQNAPAPSSASVIDSEIIIPDEEPSRTRNSNVYDASHLRGPPIILNEVSFARLFMTLICVLLLIIYFLMQIFDGLLP